MLFNEVVFIVESILKEGLEEIKQSMKSGFLYQDKGMCRAGYDLYLSIEDIYKAMSLTLEHYFDLDYEVLCEETAMFSSPRAKWVHFTNEDFKKVQKSLVEFVKKARSYHDPFGYKGNLQGFFCCKTRWCELFEQTYIAGKIKDDVMVVIYLPWAKPAQASEWDRERAYITETNYEEHDISTLEKRIELKQLSQKNMANMERIMDELRDFLIKHCTLKLMFDNRELRKGRGKK